MEEMNEKAKKQAYINEEKKKNYEFFLMKLIPVYSYHF